MKLKMLVNVVAVALVESVMKFCSHHNHKSEDEWSRFLSLIKVSYFYHNVGSTFSNLWPFHGQKYIGIHWALSRRLETRCKGLWSLGKVWIGTLKPCWCHILFLALHRHREPVMRFVWLLHFESVLPVEQNFSKNQNEKKEPNSKFLSIRSYHKNLGDVCYHNWQHWIWNWMN